MYDNIGGKIKGLAKTMFIVEAIGAVITGIVLLTTDDDLIFAGLLTLFCGPILDRINHETTPASANRITQTAAIILAFFVLLFFFNSTMPFCCLCTHKW